MSIYRPKNSPYWHYDFQFKGRRFFGSTGQKSKTEARKVEQAERTQAASGKPDVRPTTLDEASGLYWLEVAQDQPSAYDTNYQLRNLCDGLGRNELLSDIAQADLARYCARRRANVSNASVNRELQLARRVWRYAVKRLRAGVADVDWSDLMLREPPERVRELTAGEEARLFEALRPDYHDLISFLLLAGTRRSGAIGLLWSDVDLLGGRARIRLKGGRTQSLPLTPSMVTLIARQPRACAQVFTYMCIRNSGRRQRGKRYPVTKTGLRRVWGNALKAAGIADFRLHDLRHTAATRIVRTSGNLKIAQKLLGHTRIETTARYSHVNDEDLLDALTRVEGRHNQAAHHLSTNGTKRKH